MTFHPAYRRSFVRFPGWFGAAVLAVSCLSGHGTVLTQNHPIKPITP